MRLMHLADLHLGKTVNGFPLVADQRYILKRALAAAKQHEVDALLLAGDLYDKGTPSAEAVALLDWLLTAASDAGLTCLAIPGNHDSAERVAYAAGLLARQGIHVAPLFDGSVTHVTLHDQFGPVVFWLMPFLRPAHVRPHFPDVEIGQDYTAALRCVLDACPVDDSLRNVLLCHQFVTAGAQQPERSDSELFVGGLDNVDTSLFDKFDYVALGHLHRPQRIGRDEVRYAGSPLKYSFSEIPFPKSAPLVDLGEKKPGGACSTSITLLPLEPLHDMREIKGPLEALTAPDVVSEADRHDYLRVVLTDEQPAIDALTKLRAAYPNVMSVEYDNARTRAQQPDFTGSEAASENGTGDDLDLSIPSQLDLFARFYQNQNGAELDADQRRVAQEALERALGGK